MTVGAEGSRLSSAGSVRATSRLASRDLWVTPVVIFAVSRAFLALLMDVSSRLIPGAHIRGNVSVLPPTDILWRAAGWTRPWFRFDTAWYLGIAQHGYHWGALGVANTNFMPVFPFLIWVFEPLAGGSAWIASWLVANCALLAAFILIWRWSLLHLTRQAADRTLLLLAFLPFGLFLSAPYAEPVFLLLAVAAFVLAEQDRWTAAIFAAGLGTITRPVGLAVVLALVALALSRGEPRRAALAVLGLLPLVGFSIYLGLAFGHPLAFLTYHSAGWVHPHGGILTTIASQFHTSLSPFDRVDALCALVFLASGVLAWRRFGAAYGTYVLAGVLMPLAHGLVSMERYVLVLFPAAAVWAGVERKSVQVGAFTICVAGSILATILFGAGYTVI